jgi:hypothetical protein
MTENEFQNLKPGDVLRNEYGAQYMVMSNNGAQVVACSMAVMSGPFEGWELISKVANRQRIVHVDFNKIGPIKVELEDKVVLDD